jgi:hypothetical protein
VAWSWLAAAGSGSYAPQIQWTDRSKLFVLNRVVKSECYSIVAITVATTLARSESPNLDRSVEMESNLHHYSYSA